MSADDISSMWDEPDADRNASPQQSMSQSQSPPKLSFAFITQSKEDIMQAKTKKVNKSQRQAIRSHVMKTVRYEEQRRGIKRPTGREKGKKKSKALAITTRNRASSSKKSRKAHKNGSLAHATKEVSRQLGHIVSMDTVQHHPLVPESEFIAIVDSLEVYCRLVYIPMTFPVERSEEEQNLRWNQIVKYKTQNPALFYGIMTTVAAHRAIHDENIKDFTPSGQDNNDSFVDVGHIVMRAEAFRHTNSQLAQMKQIDIDCIEAIFSLISAASIVGNFQEVQFHLRSIKKILQIEIDHTQLQGGDSHWISMIDIKASIAMMTKPCLGLPWSSQPVPTELLEKVVPHGNLPLRKVGSSFWLIPCLSVFITERLKEAIFLCWFHQFSHECHQGLHSNECEHLNAIDHEIFRHKTLELEYDLIAHPFHTSSPQGHQFLPEQVVPPLERMVRLAALAMISSTVTQVPPATGVGRALTGHQVRATQDYFNSNPDMTDIEARLVLWIMFQYTQGAHGQPEEAWFRGIIANINNRDLHFDSWQQIEEVAYMFLWMPAQQEADWRRIWEDVVETNFINSEYSSM